MITVFVTHQFIFLFINEFVVFIFTDCSNSFIEIGLPAPFRNVHHLTRVATPFKLLCSFVTLSVYFKNQTYTPEACITPFIFPSQPSFQLLVLKISCPHRLNILNSRFSAFIAFSTRKKSFLPSLFGVKAFGTAR